MRKNWLEWAVFLLGLVLSAGLLGYFAFRMFHEDYDPPQLAIAFGAPAAQSDGYLVPVEVENRGEQTARNVQVTLDGGSSETVLQIPFLPSATKHEAWVWFPGAGEAPKPPPPQPDDKKALIDEFAFCRRIQQALGRTRSERALTQNYVASLNLSFIGMVVFSLRGCKE